MLLCWQANAAKARVPGCEEWGRRLHTTAEDPFDRLTAVVVPPSLQPHLKDLVEGVCCGNLVGYRSTVPLSIGELRNRVAAQPACHAKHGMFAGFEGMLQCRNARRSIADDKQHLCQWPV